MQQIASVLVIGGESNLFPPTDILYINKFLQWFSCIIVLIKRKSREITHKFYHTLTGKLRKGQKGRFIIIILSIY